MPICISCTTQTPYLYTVYESANNLRLEECSSCHAFADPYVEHDNLVLFIDLILLKRGVYRHLLFNRGTEPRRSGSENKGKEREDAGYNREKKRWLLVMRLGSALVILDACELGLSTCNLHRLTYYRPRGPADDSPPWSRDDGVAFLRVLLGCLAETAIFHGGIIFACHIMLSIQRFLSSRGYGVASSASPGIRSEFRLSLIPLSLFYSSLTKLFLLFLLSIWRPATAPIRPSEHILERWDKQAYIAHALQLLDDDKIDREWVVRNVLGGMSAGFALRVILDSHPLLSMLVILVGWMAKTGMARVVSSWVGGDERTGEAWLAYSIP
ncbi:hypothetical protein PLEOSDRAFT_1058809 [Pleurotus ostreatus PC15]|uniref:Protein ARV n=1 Tax=Pleurotus ostreatus (strain PC15) TaxID=1137138 RepID=A0A067ND85_PLEO1|nr:hypothetical protein PLEOSDRAFT_1058809 [Pleurotus ostreatus PC15]